MCVCERERDLTKHVIVLAMPSFSDLVLQVNSCHISFVTHACMHLPDGNVYCCCLYLPKLFEWRYCGYIVIAVLALLWCHGKCYVKIECMGLTTGFGTKASRVCVSAQLMYNDKFTMVEGGSDNDQGTDSRASIACIQLDTCWQDLPACIRDAPTL